MAEVALNLRPNGSGSFYITDNDEKIAEMVIDISGSDLTVYHTEVSPKAAGKGLAKKLLNAMADYSRKNRLKVIALCPYVYKQFQRHVAEYTDIWKNKKTI